MLQSAVAAARNLVAPLKIIQPTVVHTAFPYAVWVTTTDNAIEVGGRCNDWLAEQRAILNVDYICTWRAVPGLRDHYRFSFATNGLCERFKTIWSASVVSCDN